MKKFIVGLLFLFIQGGELLHAAWTTAQTLPSYTVEANLGTITTSGNINMAYNTSNNTVVGVWPSNSDSYPYYGIFNGTEWTTFGSIPAGSSTGVYAEIFATYDANNETIVAAWRDSDTGTPYYSVFNGTSWTTAAPIGTITSGTGVGVDIVLAYDAADSLVFATWGNSLGAFYSTFDGTNWSTIAAIPIGASSGVLNNVVVTYDATDELIFAAWGDTGSSIGTPYYSIFNGTSWSTADTIPLGASNGVKYDPVLAWDPANDTIIAAWGNRADDLPYYSVWDSTSSSWSTATAIPLGTSSGVDYNIIPTYDASTSTVVATWGDSSDGTPYYAVWSGTSWTTAAAIPQGSSAGVINNVTSIYDTSTEQVLAIWADTSTNLPYYSFFNGTSWTTAVIIPSGTPVEVDGYVKKSINLTYSAADNAVFAAWGDGYTNGTYYSIFNGSVWTTPTTISTDNFTSNDVTLAYDEANETVIAVWSNFDDQAPYYSIWNGTSWSSSNTIPLGSSSGVWDGIGLTYDAANQTIIAAWADNDSEVNYYSVWDGTSWFETDTIPLGGSARASDNIALTYNATSQTVFAAWSNDTGSQVPYYAKWDGTSWSTAEPISLGVSNGAYGNVNLAYDGANNTVVAAWADYNIPEGVYSVFNGSSWTPGALIPLGTASIGYNINLAYDAISRVVVAAWGGFQNDKPYYSLWNGTSWTTAALIPQGSSNGVNDSTEVISLTYNAEKNTIVGVWADSNSGLPYYSVFSGGGSPPINLTGNQKKNNFGLTYELYNALQWQPNPTNQGISGYYVYRNGVKIATLSASTLSYQDHNRQKRQRDTYSVTSFSSSGESSPATITIP